MRHTLCIIRKGKRTAMRMATLTAVEVKIKLGFEYHICKVCKNAELTLAMLIKQISERSR